MDGCLIISAFLLACLPVTCLGKALGATVNDEHKNQFGDKNTKLVTDHGAGGFQSWNDLLVKRGLGQGFPFGEKNFQAWKEWMEKRGSLRPGSGPSFGNGNSDSHLQQWKEWMSKRGSLRPGSGPSFGNGNSDSHLQQWKEWMSKRGFPIEAHELLKGKTPASNAQFQQWADWMKKRGLGDHGNGADMFGEGGTGKFQSWADFSKKANSNFGGEPDFMGMGGMQPWQSFQKRLGPVTPSNPFSVPFDFNPHLMKWDAVYKRSAGEDKRQLGGSQAGFGHYRQYFTNGLQDWRKMFQGAKRLPHNLAVQLPTRM